MGTQPHGIGAEPNPHSAQLAKAAQAAQQALATLYHECHQLEPEGPMCDAVQKTMAIIAEVHRYFETNHGAPGAAGPAVSEAIEPSEAEGPMGPGPGGPPMGGSPLQGPAAALRAAMMARAAQRQQPPAGM